MITRKGLGLFFSVLGLLEAESFLWHDVLCCHTNNCPQPKWGMAQRKKWVTKTQRTLGSTLITIYLEASSRHRNTPLPPITMFNRKLLWYLRRCDDTEQNTLKVFKSQICTWTKHRCSTTLYKEEPMVAFGHYKTYILWLTETDRWWVAGSSSQSYP